MQKRFKEYREKVRQEGKEEEKKKHEDYARQCEDNEKLQLAKDKMYKQFF